MGWWDQGREGLLIHNRNLTISIAKIEENVKVGFIFAMKKDIHPSYFAHAVATCACGATYTVGSTRETISVEICSACHPFYTGTSKTLDTAGRVERFKARVAKVGSKKAASK